MKKYVVVGTGNRGYYMYILPLERDFKDVAKIVGIHDINRRRAEFAKNACEGTFTIYEDFDSMLIETNPDYVIVATVDSYHDEYIIKALEFGCDVITEKPMTTDENKCNAILNAEKRSGKKVIVTFNARCGAFSTKIKEIIKDGAIGEVLSVHFEWLLDTVHGADYFRRWHRNLHNSGGLLVHKATHHFDMINWFIEQDPVEVSAYGTRRFYGPTREKRSTRCLTCEYNKTCEFYFDIMQPAYIDMYVNCEDDDGYYRDRCVFDEDIGIYDSMTLNVKYTNETIMSYSLTAHSPFEGYNLMINGTLGRLEASTLSKNTQKTFTGASSNSLKVYNRRNEETIVNVPIIKGDHGGADKVLQNLLFRNEPDPFNYLAGSREGTMSLIIGVAANKSIKEGKMIKVSELINT